MATSTRTWFTTSRFNWTKIFLIVFLCSLTLNLDKCDSSPIYEHRQDGNSYFFKYDSDEGAFREERGELVTKGKEEILVVNGYYRFYGKDGQLNRVVYQADENGYTAKVANFYPPPSDPIPSAALASLAGGGLG